MSDSSGPETLSIEVVFALRDRQELVTVLLDAGATVEDAIGQSSIQSLFPEWNLGECAVGIWGRRVDRDQRLQPGDRVEIYRPLAMDPREARRQLAAQGKSMGKSVADADAQEAGGARGTDEKKN
jgi:putative ubiquitin-RnfH superfamily antitoxin RatB of RatAB toxin-antitoxin module